MQVAFAQTRRRGVTLHRTSGRIHRQTETNLTNMKPKPSESINNRATNRWKQDVANSVDFYNAWFLDFAPPSFREARVAAAKKVEAAFLLTDSCRRLDARTLLGHPEILAVARQLTCPPLARDRLSGLSGVSSSFLKRCEESNGKALRPGDTDKLQTALDIVSKMLDKDILTWISSDGGTPSAQRRNRAALVVADRLCGALADPILRNAQEQRQLDALSEWLRSRGYRLSEPKAFSDLEPGRFAIHVNMPCRVSKGSGTSVNVSVDLAVLPKSAKRGDVPILIEAKSAGDFVNVYKRRKEEGQKMSQLRTQYGDTVRYILFLCGYFDTQYLGYEAAEGIDWVWEHRISDMEGLGL